MKKPLTLFVFFSLHLLTHAQGGMWTWMKGDSTLNSIGNTGTIGVSDSANYPCGRYQAVQWTDLNGNFWIFGGLGLSGERNDLWRYDVSTNIWTWMNGPDTYDGWGVYGTMGVPASSNIPGARSWGAVSWTDQQGRLWMHGGMGYDRYGSDNVLDDMWMYDISTNQWTWMQGEDTVGANPSYGVSRVSAASNTPGPRWECNTGWLKSDGTLWTFGGEGDHNYSYNDMWMYDISTNQWTWMNGPQGTGQPYSYGVLNVPSPANIPPGRGSYSHWQDTSDNFYIFAGTLRVGSSTNDVWEYNMSNNVWIWIGGDSVPNDPGQYSQLCAPGSLGARGENRTVQLNMNPEKLWSYGGFTYNDLWYYNIHTRTWTWVSGSSNIYSPGSYGTIRVPAPSNLPTAAAGGCLWMDSMGVLWSYGGLSEGKVLDAMWKFVPDTTCVQISCSPSVHSSGSAICSGDSVFFNRNYVYRPGIYRDTLQAITGCDSIITLQLTVKPNSNDTVTESICMGDSFLFGGIELYSVGYYSQTYTATNSCDSIITLNLNINPLPSVAWFQKATIVPCHGVLPLTGSTPAGGYYIGPYVSGDSIISPDIDSTFTVSYIYTDSNGCNASASLQFHTQTCTGIASINDARDIQLYPNPATQSCSIYISYYSGENYTARLTDMTGKEMSTWSFAGSMYTFSVSPYASGVYLLQINDSSGGQTVKKLVVE